MAVGSQWVTCTLWHILIEHTVKTGGLMKLGVLE
jgi:hypothetical protein